MESKQTPRNSKGSKASRRKTVGDLSNHLADIELKLDHIIERIKDSLHRQGVQRPKNGEDGP